MSSAVVSFSSGRSDGVMRTMNTEKLLKTIPIIQNQMDVLLDFNVSGSLLAAGRAGRLRDVSVGPNNWLFFFNRSMLMNWPTAWSTQRSCSSSKTPSDSLQRTTRASSTFWVSAGLWGPGAADGCLFGDPRKFSDIDNVLKYRLIINKSFETCSPKSWGSLVNTLVGLPHSSLKYSYYSYFCLNMLL